MADFRLDRLSSSFSMVTPDFKPTQAFQRRDTEMCSKIETAFDNQQDQLDAIAAVQADLASQLAQILAVTRNDAVSSSYTVPTLVMSSADAGTDCTITIVNHQRYYGDNTHVAVDGAVIVGHPYSTTFAVYYDDINREGGIVQYLTTNDLLTAQNNYVPGRHYVATITTPAALGAPTSGGTPPPGSGYSAGTGTGSYALP